MKEDRKVKSEIQKIQKLTDVEEQMKHLLKICPLISQYVRIEVETYIYGELKRFFHELPDLIKSVVREALEPFFAEGYVHGDLRSANLYVHINEQKVLMVDFDWSGCNGKVTYPPNVQSNSRIWHPEAELSLRFIESKHDQEMVEHL